MDFLNQAIGQIRDLFLSMTPAARVTAALLVGVIGVSLGYLVQQHSAGPDDFLFNGEFLAPRDADYAEAAIAQANLNGYERVGNRIRVPRSQKAEYLAAVADAGALPPNFHTLLDKALDQNPFTDRETSRQRLKAGREQQLSMIISEMAGIEEAKVIFDIREARGLSKTAQATATVSVLPTPGETLDPRRAKMIRKAVAGAIAGLEPDDVAVISLGEGPISATGSEISHDSFDDPYFQHRIAYERLMKANIEDLLSNIPGVRVQVTAELDETLERTTRTTVPQGEVVAQKETTQEDISTITQEDKGGRPGLIAQGPTRNSEQTAEAIIKNETSSNTRQADNVVGQKDEYLRETGLAPKHVRAAIAIPKDYLLSVWREEERLKGNDPNQPLPDNITSILQGKETLIEQKVQDMVVPLLPKRLAEDQFSAVKVSFFETLAPDPIEPPSMANQALSWASQNFNTMTMAVIAFVSLFMLRSMVKAIPPPEPATAINAATLLVDGNEDESASSGGEENETTEEGRPKLRLKKGTSLKDDLTDIVREDPDAAAAILRNWIGNAG